MSKVTLPMLAIKESEGGIFTTPPNSPFYLHTYPQDLNDDVRVSNEGWKCINIGCCVVLTLDDDITITINMGSWDDGAEACGTISCAGSGLVGTHPQTFIYEDAPKRFKGEFSSAMLVQFYNWIIYNLLDDIVSESVASWHTGDELGAFDRSEHC